MPDSYRSPGTPPRRRFAEWLLLAAILLCGALISAYFAWSEQRLLEATETERMGAQARIVDEHLRRQLAGLHSALESVRAAGADGWTGCHGDCAEAGLRALRRAMPGVRALLVVSRDGNVLARDGSFDARHFDGHALVAQMGAMRDPTQLYFIQPGPVAANGLDSEMALLLPAPGGGAVLALLDKAWFGVLMQSVLYAPDMRCVLTAEGGQRILSVPGLTRATRGADAFFAHHLHSGAQVSVTRGRSPETGDERLVVQRSVLPAATSLDRTLVVSISRNLGALLLPSEHLLYVYGIAWLALALASVTVLLTVQRRRRALQEWSERHQAERAADAQRIDMALDGAGLGLWEWDLVANRMRLDPRGAAMLGHAALGRDEVDGDWLLEVHPADRPLVEQALARHLHGQQVAFEVEYRQRHANGSWIWIHSRGRVVERDAQGRALRMVGTRQDIGARKQAEEEIQQLAFYDSLTDLPNRRLLNDRLSQALVKAARHHRAGAILFVDLDNFKNLNDTLGHDMGDRLLQQVAYRLRDAARESDTVARLGGDEFVILLEDLDEFGGKADERAALVADKVLSTLSTAYFLEGHEVHITPSIGIAVFGEQERTVDELLKQADLAMYDAKAAGRNTFRFFAPIMQVTLDEQAKLENDLRHAVRRNELLLHFQPIADDAGRTICAEALLRWQHPERGLLGPGQFIPVAEKSGLILTIGQWVLEQACQQLAQWSREACGNGLQVAVNVSARQFRQDDFVDQVLQALRRSGADARQLKLELTESILLHDVEEVIARMTILKAHGVSFALDDFGTGYSSLTYLQRLPLDQLKIDRSFVHDMLASQNAATIVGAIVGLAGNLDMDVVAEGVETEPQRRFLAACGCRHYQGHLIGKPVPAEKLCPGWQVKRDCVAP